MRVAWDEGGRGGEAMGEAQSYRIKCCKPLQKRYQSALGKIDAASEALPKRAWQDRSQKQFNLNFVVDLMHGSWLDRILSQNMTPSLAAEFWSCFFGRRCYTGQESLGSHG